MHGFSQAVGQLTAEASEAAASASSNDNQSRRRPRSAEGDLSSPDAAGPSGRASRSRRQTGGFDLNQTLHAPLNYFYDKVDRAMAGGRKKKNRKSKKYKKSHKKMRKTLKKKHLKKNTKKHKIRKGKSKHNKSKKNK